MKLFGIQVSIHWSYWIMMLFFMFNDILTLNYLGLASDVVFFSTLTSLVVGHELAHALTARKFGYQTLGITLHLLGGVALINLSRIKPREEFWIALAGPAFNLILGIPAIILFFLNPNQSFLMLTEPDPTLTLFGTGLLYFGTMNMVMGLFNLIPAYPMDGGRIIRSLLSHWDRIKVLNISNALTVLFASLFIIVGLVLASPMLMILGGVLVILVWAERKKMVIL